MFNTIFAKLYSFINANVVLNSCFLIWVYKVGYETFWKKKQIYIKDCVKCII